MNSEMTLTEDGLTTDQYYDPATGDTVEASFEQELALQLESGEIAVVIEICWEKLRYLTGWSWAVNADGEVVGCDITEIYERAKKLRPQGEITLCEY